MGTKRTLTAASLALAAALAVSGPAQAYLVSLDQWVITKNGLNGIGGSGVYLNDTFGNNLPMPDTEATFPSGSTATISTAGTWGGSRRPRDCRFEQQPLRIDQRG